MVTSVIHAERDGYPLPSRSLMYGGSHLQCTGRADPPLHMRRYENFCFSVVVSGSLEYATDAGSGLAERGAILTGNRQEAFTYRLSSTEPVVRSLVAVSSEIATEIAADLDLSRTAFPAPLLAPSGQTLRLYAAIRRLAAFEEADEALVFQTVANLMTHGRAAPGRDATQAEQRRVRQVAHYLDSAFAEPITLDQMAEQANLSRFHFIRVFREVIGETPRKHLIAARLRAAADRLLETREPVISVALNTGFNDVSHFTNSFRRAFGLSPRQLRATA